MSNCKKKVCDDNNIKEKTKVLLSCLSFIEFPRVFLDGVTMREILIGDANSDQNKGWKDPHWETKKLPENLSL